MRNSPSPVHPATPNRPRLFSRRLAALFAGVLISLFAVGSALATAPPGSVTVEATGCTFTVNINLDQGWPVVTWKVKVYDAANWKDGETLIKGSVNDDPDGKIVAGPYTLPEGHYNVVVDNETTIDGSAIVTEFVLSCPESTPSASPTGSELPGEGSPSASPSESQSASPTGSELPVEGSPSASPTGEVLPTEGTPQPTNTGAELPAVGGAGTTPPPTDTGAARAATSTGMPGAWLTFLAIVAIGTFAFTMTSRHLARTRVSSNETRSRR